MGLREELTEFVRLQVALGIDPYRRIVESTVYYLTGEAEPDEIVAIAAEVAAIELAAHCAAQETWPEVTDSDRLTAAFRELDESGIVARECFKCCQSCGLRDIGGEVKGSPAARGYVFYHQQDAEACAGGVGGKDLYLAYGHFGRPPTAEIGTEVTDVLRRHGLTVQWNGSTSQRIEVRLEWHRRRVGPLAEFPRVPA